MKTHLYLQGSVSKTAQYPKKLLLSPPEGPSTDILIGRVREARRLHRKDTLVLVLR